MALIGKRTELPRDPVVHHVFEAHARRAPDRIALTSGEERLTFAELDARANRFAHHLLARGAGRGSIIGVCLDRTPDLLVAILGVLKAGGAYVPLDPTNPAERLRLLLSQLDQLKLTVASADTAELVASGPGELVLVDAPEKATQLAEQPDTAPRVELDGDDLCYVVFTSGSTGVPKATAIRHSGWYNLLEWLRVEYGLDAGSSGLTVSSFGFDISQRGLMAPLFCGAASHLLPSRYFDVVLAHRLIGELGVRQLHCAPSTLYTLIEHEEALGADELTKVGHVFIGGEPLASSRIARWAEREGNECVLLHQFGVAECTDVATSHLLGGYARYTTVTPVGFPVYNTEIWLLTERDGELVEVPDGEPGEICISGLSVSAGYVNAQRHDTRRFTELSTSDGPVPLYRTGDVGYATPDGELVVVGRLDTQVKIRGMRMDLGDVEYAVRAHRLVRDVVVLAIGDNVGELALASFVLPEGGEPIDTRELYRDLVQVLPRTMVPQRCTVVDAFPLTPNGKVDRKALAALAAG